MLKRALVKIRILWIKWSAWEDWGRLKTQGTFLVRDNRVLNGPLGRSLRSFARTAHSAYSLRSTLFTGSLTHFAHSLVGQLKFLNMCSHCYRVSREQTRFWRSLESRPKDWSRQKRAEVRGSQSKWRSQWDWMSCEWGHDEATLGSQKRSPMWE